MESVILLVSTCSLVAILFVLKEFQTIRKHLEILENKSDRPVVSLQPDKNNEFSATNDWNTMSYNWSSDQVTNWAAEMAALGSKPSKEEIAAQRIAWETEGY